MAKKTIVICSSANFFEHSFEISILLKKTGYKILVPITIRKMKKSGNFNAENYKTWHKDSRTFKRKTYLMKNHFDKIASSDAILVVNDEKRRIKGYIGASALMEMGLAFYLNKPIFVLNDVHEGMSVYEEVKAMNCIIIDGDLSKIKL